METNKLQDETKESKILLVTYDIKRFDMNYKSLYDILKSANSWCHHIDATWFIKTEEPTKHWYDIIQKVIDPKDYFIIIDITGQLKQGWMPKETWEWFEINDNNDKQMNENKHNVKYSRYKSESI